MTDLALQTFADGTIDIVLFGGDLLADDSLRPAIAASLLTDREYPEAPDGDRRGSWQDALLADPNDRNGSLLWRLTPGKRTAAKLAEAKGHADQALAWLTEDGIASGVTVTPSYDARGLLQLDIAVTGPSGVQQYRLAELWQASLGPSPVEQAQALIGEVAGITGGLEHIYYVQYPEFADVDDY